MKCRLYVILGITLLMLAACQIEQKGEVQSQEQIANELSEGSPISEGDPEPGFDANTEPAMIPDGAADPRWLDVNGIPIALPNDWFFAEVIQDPVNALAFANQDLRALQLNGAVIDADTLRRFIKGALIVSPLPAGGDPQALRTGLAANLDKYTSADLEGMLFVADDIGLINLLEIENVVLDTVDIGAFDQIPALVMSGSYEVVDSQDGSQSVRVWLTWTDEHFVSFYEIANASIFADAGAHFDFIRQSMQLD